MCVCVCVRELVLSLQNPPNFISSELKKYGHHFPETLLKL